MRQGCADGDRDLERRETALSSLRQLRAGARRADPLRPARHGRDPAGAGHAGRILALEEGHFPYELSGELETLGCESYGGRLETAFTAHPKLCPETNELHFFGYGYLAPYLVYHVLDSKGALVYTADISVPGPTMMHDFMITRDHAIFMDLPVTFSLEKAMKGEIPLGWDPDYGARIGILPRMGADADVRWFEIDPCYVFHPMNAYVDGNRVICDVGRHEYMWRESMNDFAPSYLHRWEFDLERGTSSMHDFGRSAQPGELVFAEASDSAGEDEGYALGFVYDKARDASDLVILDASGMAQAPIATIHMPRRVPYGFHGSWIRG